MSLNHGGGGTAGAGVGGSGGAGGGAGQFGLCAIQGGGVVIETSDYNAVMSCECSYNNNANLSSNIGGNGNNENGGGAGVGGGGGSGGDGGQGGCLLQGGGIFIGLASGGNIVSGCIALNNNTSNFTYNTGGNGNGDVGAAAGVGGGGSAEYSSGGLGTCSIQGGGTSLDSVTNSAIHDCVCMSNNGMNFIYNVGGSVAHYAAAGVGGGGGGGTDGAVGPGYCSMLGGGCFVNFCTNTAIQSCTFQSNNNSNFNNNTGGNGGLYGGAGVGSGARNGGVPSYCYCLGGGLYILGIGTKIQECLCAANNVSNLSNNIGPSGAAGVGDGGYTVGTGNCYIIGGGVYLSADGNSLEGCGVEANNTNNLVGNSSISPTSQVYQDLAGIYVGASSCNVVNGCDMTANVTCGLQLGSPINTQFNTLADNLIMNCSAQGTTGCGQSAELDGIVSYATTATNWFENNVARNCSNGFVATAGSADVFTANTAYNNGNQYVNVTTLPIINTASTSGNPASNLQVP
jgi:hypothetical protein